MYLHNKTISLSGKSIPGNIKYICMYVYKYQNQTTYLYFQKVNIVKLDLVHLATKTL